MLRGQAELVTTFEVDANGLLKVSAQDRASGRKASISMTFISIQVDGRLTGDHYRHHKFGWTPLIR